MRLSRLISLLYKSIFRDVRFDLSFILRIFSYLSITYFLGIIFFAGLHFDKIVTLISPDLDSERVFSYVLFLSFLSGIIILVVSHNFYQPAIIALMHLPVSRRKVILFLFLKSGFNLFNLAFIVFVLPYSLSRPDVDFITEIYYLGALLLLLLLANNISFFLSNLFKLSYKYLIIVTGSCLLLIFSGGLFGLTIQDSVYGFYDRIINKDAVVVSAIIFIFLLFVIANYKLSWKILYNVYNTNNKNPVLPARHKHGIFPVRLSTYLALELKLIFRNKRPVALFILAIFFIILFLMQIREQNELFSTFAIYLLISGIFGYIFAQYLFSWESSFFEFICSSGFNISKYLRSKHYLYSFLSLVSSISLIAFNKSIGENSILFLTALSYNIGFGFFVFFFTATYNTAKINLEGSILFNNQGFSIVQMASLIIILLFPCLILGLLNRFMSLNSSLLVMTFLFLASFLSQKYWFRIIGNHFKRRKYIALSNFRA